MRGSFESPIRRTEIQRNRHFPGSRWMSCGGQRQSVQRSLPGTTVAAGVSVLGAFRFFSNALRFAESQGNYEEVVDAFTVRGS
jgi:hypothetical protein